MLFTCYLAAVALATGTLVRDQLVEVSFDGGARKAKQSKSCSEVMNPPAAPAAQDEQGLVVRAVTFNVEGHTEYGEKSQWETIRKDVDKYLVGEAPLAHLYFIALQEKTEAKVMAYMNSPINEEQALNPSNAFKMTCMEKSSGYIGGCVLCIKETCDSLKIKFKANNGNINWPYTKGCNGLEVKTADYHPFSLYSCHFDSEKVESRLNNMKSISRQIKKGTAIIGGDMNHRVHSDSIQLASDANEVQISNAMVALNQGFEAAIKDANEKCIMLSKDEDDVENTGKVCKASDENWSWASSCSGYKFSENYHMYDELDKRDTKDDRNIIKYFSELPLSENSCLTCKWEPVVENEDPAPVVENEDPAPVVENEDPAQTASPELIYNSKKLPGQCDRILFVGDHVNGKMGEYGVMTTTPLLSDHLPVKGIYRILPTVG